MENELKYTELMNKYIYNVITNVSEIAKCLGVNLNDMTNDVGFSISAVSRIRNKVKKEPDKAYDNLPYALCMLTSIDYICFFYGVKSETQLNIQNMLFKDMCEPSLLFYKVDGSAEFTTNIKNQPWYKVDYTESRGFVYQLKYFIYCKKQEEKSKQRNQLENELRIILNNCEIAFTLMGYKHAKSNFYEIKDLLKSVYKNNNTIYLSSLIREAHYYGRLSLPDEGSYEIQNYSDDIKKEEYSEFIIDIYNLVLKKIDDNYVLLFVKNEDEKLYCKELMGYQNQDKIVYAYYSYFSDVKRLKLVFDYKDTFFVVNNPNNILDFHDQITVR